MCIRDRSGRPGGVYLDLPAKLFAQTMDAAAGKASLIKVVDAAPRQIPAPDAVKRALDLLKGAKKPLILLGKGAAYAPVSYTHLDVYKRQVMKPAQSANGLTYVSAIFRGMPTSGKEQQKRYFAKVDRGQQGRFEERMIILRRRG